MVQFAYKESDKDGASNSAAVYNTSSLVTSTLTSAVKVVQRNSVLSHITHGSERPDTGVCAARDTL